MWAEDKRQFFPNRETTAPTELPALEAMKTGTPGHQQHLHQCQESKAIFKLYRICRMGLSCISFMQSVKDFRCIGLWGWMLGAADLRCARMFCDVVLRRTVEQGVGTLHHIPKQEYNFIFTYCSTSFCQGVQQVSSVSGSFIIPITKSCNSTIVPLVWRQKKERGFIWLWQIFLLNSQINNVKRNKQTNNRKWVREICNVTTRKEGFYLRRPWVWRKDSLCLWVWAKLWSLASFIFKHRHSLKSSDIPFPLL